MLITAFTGSETFQGKQAKLQLFMMPSREFALPKEEFIGIACKRKAHGSRTVQFQKHLAAPGYLDEFGAWFEATYDVPQGMCLKLFAYRKQEWTTSRVTGSIILQPRDGAAIRRIRWGLTQDARAAFTEGYVEGQFDILPLLQAEQEEGVQVLPATRQFFRDPAQVGFTIEELTPERVMRVARETVTVENSRGDEVEVARRQRRRQLDLD